MKEPRPAAFEAAAELKGLLRELGQTAAPVERSAQAEVEREARMAASIDRELSGLVRAERASRRGLTLAGLAAAAVVLVTLGVRHTQQNGGGTSIAQEPLRPVKAQPRKPADEPAPEPAALPQVPSVALARSSSPAPSASGATSAEPRSTLGEENQLFKAAAEATRVGDVSGALQRLDELLTQYPKSPLAQTAQVRKFRLLAKAGKLDEARREAERYLVTYPTGFAVTEAEALEQGSKPEGAAPAPEERPSP